MFFFFWQPEAGTSGMQASTINSLPSSIRYLKIIIKKNKDSDAWADLAGSSCGGKQQSPVDIHPWTAVRKAFPKFTFHNYVPQH